MPLDLFFFLFAPGCSHLCSHRERRLVGQKTEESCHIKDILDGPRSRSAYATMSTNIAFLQSPQALRANNKRRRADSLDTGAFARTANEACHFKAFVWHVLYVDHRLLCAHIASFGLGHEVHACDMRPPAVVCWLHRAIRHRAQDTLNSLQPSRAGLTRPIALGH